MMNTRTLLAAAVLLSLPLSLLAPSATFAASNDPCKDSQNSCVENCMRAGNPTYCGYFGCHTCADDCGRKEYECRTGQTCTWGTDGEIWCLDVDSLSFGQSAAQSQSNHPSSSTAYFFNVRAQVATTTYLSGPVRWTASATWFIDDTGHHSESCMLYVLPFTPQLDNGYVEFPGVVTTPGTLGNYCATVAEGSIICIDGRVLSTPTLFGQFVVVDGVRNSGC